MPESYFHIHTLYAMQTNHHHYHHHHHHDTYESPKQYYSTQISHTFINDNIDITCTKNYTFNYI